MGSLRIAGLPDAALAAAAQFHAADLPRVREALAGGAPHLALVFAPADRSHRAWRLAAVQSLAREFAPVRVNALSSNSEPAIAAALAYLGTAAGITGQLLELDDTGAGGVLSSSS